MLALCLCASFPSRAQEADNPAVRLFDTGTASPKPLSEEAVTKHDGWKLVPEDDLTHPFTGDAVLLNDKLIVVLRTAKRMAEVYSNTEKGAKLRASVGHVSPISSFCDPYEAPKIIENTGGAVVLEAAIKLHVAPTLRFRLTTGERILEIRPGGGAYSVVVQSKSRHVVVPDFFGDDMVFTGEPSLPIELPAENFFLGLLGEGDALLMCAWKSDRQAVSLHTVFLAGLEKSETRCVGRITCEGDKPIWLAVIEGPSAWHGRPAGVEDTWKPPFPAAWRCSRVGETAFADSWDLATGPAPEQKARKGDGPTLIYPFDRTADTPLTAFSLVDLMRNTMGKGPCQYVLEQEGLAGEGNPTPDGVMAWVENQFQKEAAAKAADAMAERFTRMVDHVRLTQARIGKYAAFAQSIRALCMAENAREHTRGLLPTVERIEQTLKAYSDAAATPERAAQLAAEVVALARKEGAAEECERLGAQVRAIGLAQDRTLSKSRMAVLWLRSQARLAERTDQKSMPGYFAGQVGSRVDEFLSKP